MNIIPLPIPGAFKIEYEKKEDDRGFFQRVYCENFFEKTGLPTNWVNTNTCFNKLKKTTRGLHYQSSPFEEDKLVTCLDGALFDVFVDMRPLSKTYLQWFGIELSKENNTGLIIPKGCAHGYQTLTDNTLIMYQVSQFYHPTHEQGVRWNDPYIGIKWPYTSDIIISHKDSEWPLLKKGS